MKRIPIFVKKSAVSVVQAVGYCLVFLLVKTVLMGLTKVFLFDWESEGPRLNLIGEGVLTVLGIILTNQLFVGLNQLSDVLRG